MLDRVPTYPGRVTLTPVTGQTNTYDMAMADSPTVVGTPLNKQTLLTDATAEAIGLSGTNPTPNEALAQLQTNTLANWKIGDIKFSKNTQSANWLACDGSRYASADYPLLATLMPGFGGAEYGDAITLADMGLSDYPGYTFYDYCHVNGYYFLYLCAGYFDCKVAYRADSDTTWSVISNTFTHALGTRMADFIVAHNGTNFYLVINSSSYNAEIYEASTPSGTWTLVNTISNTTIKTFQYQDGKFYAGGVNGMLPVFYRGSSASSLTEYTASDTETHASIDNCFIVSNRIYAVVSKADTIMIATLSLSSFQTAFTLTEIKSYTVNGLTVGGNLMIYTTCVDSRLFIISHITKATATSATTVPLTLVHVPLASIATASAYGTITLESLANSATYRQSYILGIGYNDSCIIIANSDSYSYGNTRLITIPRTNLSEVIYSDTKITTSGEGIPGMLTDDSDEVMTYYAASGGFEIDTDGYFNVPTISESYATAYIKAKAGY